MDKQPLKYWFSDKRAVTYLLWAVLTIFGFSMTHLRQTRQINTLWFFIVVVGLGFMVYVMPLKQRRMQAILASWAVPLITGLAATGAAFNYDSLLGLTEYLGVFWLFVMASGYIFNGLSDKPSHWYFIAAAINILAALTILNIHSLLIVQYLIAAVVSGWSMLMLWVFRSDHE